MINLNKWYKSKTYKIFMIASLSVAILLMIYPLTYSNLLNRSLSSIGRENPVWFIWWGIVLSFGFVLTNLYLFFNIKLKIQNKMSILINSIFILMVFLVFISKIISVSFFGTNFIQMRVHLISSMIFGIFAPLSIIYIFIFKVIAGSKRCIFQIIATIILMVLFYLSVLISDFTALYQIISFALFFTIILTEVIIEIKKED